MMPLFLQINSRIPSFVMSLLTGVGFGGIPDKLGSFILDNLHQLVKQGDKFSLNFIAFQVVDFSVLQHFNKPGLNIGHLLGNVAVFVGVL